MAVVDKFFGIDAGKAHEWYKLVVIIQRIRETHLLTMSLGLFFITLLLTIGTYQLFSLSLSLFYILVRSQVTDSLAWRFFRASQEAVGQVWLVLLVHSFDRDRRHGCHRYERAARPRAQGRRHLGTR